jgi:nucleoside-diphosphate-sugar epimerase
MDVPEEILVTGGAGYIGSVLVPKLLERGHDVTVLDGFFFGRDPLEPVADRDALTLVEGEIRDRNFVDRVFAEGEFDAVIHLAAISNDPSSNLDAELTTSVNRDAVQYAMDAAKRTGVDRLLYASSASVYGIKETEDVTEDLPLEPITLYAQYKAEGEKYLNSLIDDNFCGVSVRAATVCGYAPRLRLDLVVNILTSHALNRGEIRVYGGDQMRPNIHIDDITDFYLHLLEADRETINGEAYNVSRENYSVMGLAERIRDVLDRDVDITVEPTDDERSYHLSAEKLDRELDFEPASSVEDAVRDLEEAYQAGDWKDHNATIYHNVRWMQEHPEDWNFGGEVYLDDD